MDAKNLAASDLIMQNLTTLNFLNCRVHAKIVINGLKCGIIMACFHYLCAFRTYIIIPRDVWDAFNS